MISSTPRENTMVTMATLIPHPRVETARMRTRRFSKISRTLPEAASHGRKSAGGAAQDLQHAAADVGRARRRREEHVGRRQLFRLRGTPHGAVLAEFRDLLGGLIGWIERGPHRAGRHRVHADAARQYVLGPRPRERVDRT